MRRQETGSRELGLSARQFAQLRELKESIGVLRLGSAPILRSIVHDLPAILQCDRIGAYSLRTQDGGSEPEYFDIAGAKCGRRQALQLMERYLARSRRTPGVYDATCPPPSQRNRVLVFPPVLAWLDEIDRDPAKWEAELGMPAEEASRHLQDRLEPFLKPSGYDQHQLRVLLCDGETSLGFVSVAQDEPFTERQRAILETLVEPLRERLKLERRLREGPLAKAALDAALDAIGAPAFVITQYGRIQAMNAAGAALHRADSRAVIEGLRDCARGESTGQSFRLTPISAPGFPDYYLAVNELEATIDAGRLSVARARWELTARQVQVLERIVAGDSNKSISASLGLGQSTVELHVTKILEKAEVESRFELIAKFWMS